jgi:hypothetical protein
MSDELKGRNILKLILIMRLVCATFDMGHPIFCTVSDSSYRMREIRDITNVPISTLYTWRERVRQDPSWRPDPARFTANPRAIEDALEAKMAQYLQDNFVSMRRDLSTHVLKQTLIMLVQSFVASGDLPESALNFRCSKTMSEDSSKGMG